MNLLNKENVKKNYINELIKNKSIQRFSDIYNIIPKSSIAKALGLNSVSFSNSKSTKPDSFKVAEILKLAEILNVPYQKILDLIVQDIKDENQISS